MHDERASATDRNGSTILRALRSTTGRESTTFGFSILVTVAFALAQTVEGAPGVPEIFLYAAGAVMSFTVLTGLLSGGFRKPMPQHRTETLALATSLNIVSVGAGLACALPVLHLADGGWAWALAPFVATTVYLVMESVETAIAERLLLRHGEPYADEVSA
ncbi:hypothetical protein [Agrococcus citreus]|uniref:Cation transporter n=1 Tax=Agrococcus citreus TaxID=84643 RepID=A0ABP4JNT7_9MICO